MQTTNKQRNATVTLAMGAVLTALIIVLQSLAQFIKFGPFTVTLSLIPIVIGAATCGPKISTWLGFVFGVMVLFTDPLAAYFMTLNAFGTILTVVGKGVACGCLAGLVYRWLEKKNRYFSVIVAAIVSPLVNTMVFLIGCYIFFYGEIQGWAAGEGMSVILYSVTLLVGGNALFEMGMNIVLSPTVVRVLSVIKKNK